MNIKLGRISSIVTGVAVLSFALSMIIGTIFTSCLLSIFIAIGFVPFMCSIFAVNKKDDKKAVGYTGIVFAAVYAVLIFLVYYAECTTVRMNTSLSDEALSIISYGYIGSLFFNYDLLGYAFMALTTFLMAFLVEPSSRSDKILRWMLWLHGVFFISCLLVPMFPIFTASSSGGVDKTGVILLEIWCAYFIPVCILGYKYFSNIAMKEI